MSEAALTALAARLRALSTIGVAIAREAAPLILEEAKKTAAAGTTPDGTPWKPRKADGARALVNAAAALSVRTYEDVVLLVLSGVNVYQQKTRPIIPMKLSDGVPTAMAEAVRTAARRVMSRSA